MTIPEVLTDVAKLRIAGRGNGLAAGARAGQFCIGAVVRSGAHQIAAVCPWIAWVCPIFLIVRLPLASPAGPLLLWLVGSVAAILTWANAVEDSDIPLGVYLPAACGLIAGLMIAARGF